MSPSINLERCLRATCKARQFSRLSASFFLVLISCVSYFCKSRRYSCFFVIARSSVTNFVLGKYLFVGAVLSCLFFIQDMRFMTTSVLVSNDKMIKMCNCSNIKSKPKKLTLTINQTLKTDEAV